MENSTTYEFSKIGYIYKITCSLNGFVYIGLTSQIPHTRWVQHVSDAKMRSPDKRGRLQNALNKYGKKSFLFEVIDCKKFEELREREIYWISYYDSINKNKGYNISSGGESRNGVAPWCKGLTKETSPILKKMSESMSGKNNKMYGRKHSSETIEHWRKSKSGPLSASWGLKRPDTIEMNKNRIWTKEGKEKISKSNSKPIRCIQNGISYPSVRKCAEELGLHAGTVSKVLKKRHKYRHTHGYTFEYIDKNKYNGAK